MVGGVLSGGHLVASVDGEGGEVGEGQNCVHELDLIVIIVNVPPL